MARMTITGFENVEKMLEKLANPYEMAEKAVNKAAPIVEKNLKAQIRSATNRRDKYGKPYSTGELEASIAATNARDNSLGVFAVVKPNGTDKNGFRNAEKMGYLEYGVRSHGQEPRPVRAAAVAQSENAVMQVMEEVIGAEVDKL